MQSSADENTVFLGAACSVDQNGPTGPQAARCSDHLAQLTQICPFSHPLGVHRVCPYLLLSKLVVAVVWLSGLIWLPARHRGRRLSRPVGSVAAHLATAARRAARVPRSIASTLCTTRSRIARRVRRMSWARSGASNGSLTVSSRDRSPAVIVRWKVRASGAGNAGSGRVKKLIASAWARRLDQSSGAISLRVRPSSW